MITTLDAPAADERKDEAAGKEGDTLIRRRVKSAVFSRFACHGGDERRRDERWPYPYPVQLSPPPGSESFEPIIVLGKHLSERGLDFYYHLPIDARRVIASLETPDGRRVAFLLELRWCRFTRHGWYENGGRFLRVADSPAAGAAPQGG